MNRGATALLCAALVAAAAVSAVAAPVAADSRDGGRSVYPLMDCPNGEEVTGTVETADTTLRVTACSYRRTYVHEPADLNGTVRFIPTVENVGNESATAALSLVVNGTGRDVTTVSLAPGRRWASRRRTTSWGPARGRSSRRSSGPPACGTRPSPG
jgi:hypothetical protein